MVTGRIVVPDIANRVADRLNPITNSPAAPLKTRALFASFGPSLMPRAAMRQGISRVGMPNESSGSAKSTRL